MNRQGHYGVTLLAVAPIIYVFVRRELFLLALFSWVGIHAIEPLPDWDFHIPGLRHRGVSHSLLAVFSVGCILGVTGWVLSGYLNEVLLAVPTGLSIVLDSVESLSVPFSRTVHDGLQPVAVAIERHARALRESGIDRYAVAVFCGAIGAYGVLVHLLGDIITIRGLQLFLPFSRRRVDFSPLRANSSAANTVLFVLGVGAMLGALVGAVS